jgi:hypothetical protein
MTATMSYVAGERIAFLTKAKLEAVCAAPAALLTYLNNIPTRRTYLWFHAEATPARGIILKLRDISGLKGVRFSVLSGKRTRPVICAWLPSETTRWELDYSLTG